jgi:hypothetical protein
MPSEASLANLRPAWQPGQGGFTGQQARGYRRVLGLARKNSPEAMQAIIDCLRDSDPRVRLAAATTILDRAWGKPKEHMSFDGADGMNITIVTGVPDPDNHQQPVADETTTFTIEYDAGEEGTS